MATLDINHPEMSGSECRFRCGRQAVSYSGDMCFECLEGYMAQFRLCVWDDCQNLKRPGHITCEDCRDRIDQ